MPCPLQGDAERILGLADKYHVPALQSLCEATLAGFLRSGSAGAPTDAPGLLRVLASARRLGLPDLTAACSSVICGSLKKVPDSHLYKLPKSSIRQCLLFARCMHDRCLSTRHA